MLGSTFRTVGFLAALLGVTHVTALVPPSASKGSTEIGRRSLLETSGTALATLILCQSQPSFAADPTPKSIVLTGANSGIGYEAAKQLAGQGHTIVLACRSMEKALSTKERIGETPGSLVAAECDLADLKSIEKFAGQASSLLDGKKIDVLCLNAGLARNTAATDVARTADGFELTGA